MSEITIIQPYGMLTTFSMHLERVGSLSKDLTTLSRQLLPPEGQYGYAYASLSNDSLGIWYSLSDFEREGLGKVSIPLFAMNPVDHGLPQIREVVGREYEGSLPHLAAVLIPAIQSYLSERLETIFHIMEEHQKSRPS